MDVELDEEQRMLKESANEFLSEEVEEEDVRELEESEKGYSPKHWKDIAQLGWIGLVIPEEYEGMGMSFFDLTILFEEMGKNLFPSPFFSTMSGGVFPLLAGGSEEQKKKYLPKISGGELIFTPAIREEEGTYKASAIECEATEKDDAYVLNGKKMFVEKAHIADYLTCAAKTEDGLSLFIVDTDSSGLEVEVMPSIAMNKLCEVNLEDVEVPKENMIGESGEGEQILQEVIRKGSLAKCAESVGAMEACVDLTVEFAKDRVQYDVLIGAFQALQHRMANMWIAHQTCKYLVYRVAWMESEGISNDKEVSMAKSLVNEEYKWVADSAVQLHGGYGTSREYAPGLYYKRTKPADNTFGDTDYHLSKVADEIGLSGKE